MKQQTAVEWLYNNLESLFEHDGDLLEVVQFSFEQAKAMEKEQIIDAANLPKDKRWYDEKKYANCGEQYYNETYKSKQ